MFRMLIVNEKPGDHHAKNADMMIGALLKKGIEIVLLEGTDRTSVYEESVTRIHDHDFQFLSPSLDEHRFIRIFEIAKQYDIDHIYFIRFFWFARLYTALETMDWPDIPFSGTIWGLSHDYFRRPIHGYYLEKLFETELLKHLIILTNHRESLKREILRRKILKTTKISVLMDPVVDNKSDYQLDKIESRKQLNIDQNEIVFLYYGTYVYSKGADILIEAIQQLPVDLPLKFIFAGSLDNCSYDFNAKKFRNIKSIRFDDKALNSKESGVYFSAVDSIIFPYRKYYEHDDSAIIVQACLAKKPVIMPDIDPFKSAVDNYNLGLTFKCEDASDLAKQILYFADHFGEARSYGFDQYLEETESWDKRAEIILNSHGNS